MPAEGAAEGLRVGDDGELVGSGPGYERFGKMEGRARDAGETGAFRRIAEEPAQRRARPRKREMFQQAPPLMDVFPREQKKVFLEDALNVGVAEYFADGAAMLMIDDARGLIHRFPAAFPGQVAEVGVFEIERREEFIESAER